MACAACRSEVEIERIHRHVSGAATAARGRSPRRLSRLQRIVRALLLDEVVGYANDRRFPKNTVTSEGLNPVFIDHEGTPCAVAHLLTIGGALSLVAEIAATRNRSRVADIANEVDLASWLTAAGLTLEEAMAIQPSYCPSLRSACVCGGWGSYAPTTGAIGVLEITLVAKNASPAPYYEAPRYTARVDAVYGDTNGVSVGEELVVGVGGSTDLIRTGEVKALAPIYEAQKGGSLPDGGTVLGALPFPNGVLQGCNAEFVKTHPLSTQQIAVAWARLGEAACGRALAEIDDAWGEDMCGGGCSTSGDAPASDITVAILIAVVGAIGLRRHLAAASHRG